MSSTKVNFKQQLSDVLKVPSIGSNSFKVCRRNFKAFKKNLLSSILSHVFEPVILFLALGLGLSAIVSPLEGVSYFEFLFPGFLCFMAFNMSYIDCLYSIHRRKNRTNIYTGYRLSPIKREEVVVGEVLWSTFKTLINISVIVLLYLTLSNENVTKILFIYALTTLLAAVGASLGAFVSSLGESSTKAVLISSIYVFALGAISGVFFPAEILPNWLWYIATLNPVLHAVTISRSSMNFFEDYRLFLYLATILSFFFLYLNFSIKYFSLKKD